MELSFIFTFMLLCSIFFGIQHGCMPAVSSAAMDGAAAAVTLSIQLLGIMCLWCGMMEVMSACGLSQKIAAFFRPFLKHLFPCAAKDAKTLAAISANISANLLGIGNAATPLGIQAAKRMAHGCSGIASDELCRLIVLNTASIQLIPATIAGVRSACGAGQPFDILPAVWISSAISVTVGLIAAYTLQHLWRKRP